MRGQRRGLRAFYLWKLKLCWSALMQRRLENVYDGGKNINKSRVLSKMPKRISNCNFFTFSIRDFNSDFYKSLNLAYLFSTACFSCCVPCVVLSTWCRWLWRGKETRKLKRTFQTFRLESVAGQGITKWEDRGDLVARAEALRRLCVPLVESPAPWIRRRCMRSFAFIWESATGATDCDHAPILREPVQRERHWEKGFI